LEDSARDHLRRCYTCLLNSAAISRLLSMSQAGRVTAQDYGSVVVTCEAALSWATAAALPSNLDLSTPPALAMLQLPIRYSS